MRALNLLLSYYQLKAIRGNINGNSGLNLNFTGTLLELNDKRWIDLLSCGLFIICDVIKQNESEVANIDFEI